jgi:peptide/nickel transport system substrate-binding protein
MIGSGPYRFIPAEFNAGERAAYERFADFVPRAGEPLRYNSGGKVAHFDRVEWRTISDIATAVAALTRGEVDWIDSVPADLVPPLARDHDVTVEVTEPTGSIPLLRFNCLHPPFDNAAMRRAMLGAVDQSEVMRAVAGSDPSAWRDRVGLFSPNSRMANGEGIEVLSGPRDRDRVRRELAAAGYDGRPVVVLSSFQPYFRESADVVADQLGKAGVNLDVQTMDLPTMLRRLASKEPPEKGGWNAFVSLTDGLFIDNPVSNSTHANHLLFLSSRSSNSGAPGSSFRFCCSNAMPPTASTASAPSSSRSLPGELASNGKTQPPVRPARSLKISA